MTSGAVYGPTGTLHGRLMHGIARAHLALVFLLCASGVLNASTRGDDDVRRARDLVRQAQDRLIETIDRVSPAVVCVFDRHERGGGSGVLIDPDGYGLTNYHVVAGMLATRRGLGGLNDGRLYDLEVLGIDPTGDVAMFRLYGRERFPYAELGDSDTVRVGDTAIAMGNPFTLSEDYTPSVTVGLVTGVHRYQWGIGNNLIYSDCIQTDASINPGNSGGPLFNEYGEIIGINGRISVNTRGRFNVGHGYAISANQIRRFIPWLRAGLLAKHGTLQATVESAAPGAVFFGNVRAGYSADRAGVRIGDRLRYFDGVPIDSPNRFASVIGTYPAGWTVSLTLERNGAPVTVEARLDPVEPKLERPFEPDSSVVNQAVLRVLSAYRAAMFPGRSDAALPARMSWILERRESLSKEAADVRKKRYTATLSFDSGGRLERIEDADGRAEVIEFDAHSAARRFGDGDDQFALPLDEAMMLRALYIGQVDLLTPSTSFLPVAETSPVQPDETDAATSVQDAVDDGDHAEGPAETPVVAVEEDASTSVPATLIHAGGDALPIEWRFPARRSRSGVMEVLRLSLGEGATADFGFDTTTGLLASIRIEDAVSGMTARAVLSDYREMNGMRWPTAVRVELPGRTYTDRFSNFEVSR